MPTLRTFALTAAMAVAMAWAPTVLGPIGPGRVAAHAGSEHLILWYCKVSYKMNGKIYYGYLGGYNSEAEARRQYQNWAKGLGAGKSPKLLKVYSE